MKSIKMLKRKFDEKREITPKCGIYFKIAG
jgi:hypothetical protein